MDFDFLADDLKQILQTHEPENEAVCILRGSGSFNGKSGESYLIAYEENIYLFERPFGEHKYSGELGKLKDVALITLEKDKFSSLLKVDFGSSEYSMKVSALELGCAEELLSYAAGQECKIKKVDLDKEKNTLCAGAGFAACLTFAATVDEELSEAENDYIKKVCADDALFNQGVTYYEEHSFAELLQDLELDNQQKLCFLANIFELTMSDGVLSSNEADLIDQFVKAMDISEEDFLNIKNTLLIKNQLSVLE